jgi:hypothetical protein
MPGVMKKTVMKLFLFVFSLLAGSSLLAQDCEAYFPMEEGAVREMESYNHKDKLEGKITYTVKEVRTEGDVTLIVTQMVMEDKKGEETYETELVMECEEGVFKIDMKNYMQAGMMPEAGDMEVEVNSKNLEFPSELKPGMELPDGYITVNMGSGGMSMMNLRVDILNRKVEGIETIDTPAGKFECYKISQESEVKTIMTIKASSIEWIAKEVGTVRSESYNKKGKLQGYTVLTAYEK